MTLLVRTFTVSSFVLGLAAALQCKASPGSSDWPSLATWASFNKTVDGRLLRPPPPGAVCHPDQVTYDAAVCADVQTAWSTEDFHYEDPISIMWNQYTNDSCLPYPEDPCSDTGYPAYAVNATTPLHVQAAILFACKNKVRVVIKSSGHDYLGRSIAPGAMTIWLRYMSGVEALDGFSPQGCDFSIATTAARVLGGTTMSKLDGYLNSINEVSITGTDETVTVGGYITGGGHSILSPKYGLAADNVLEIELVTPTGEIITANECQNQDYFWAMRGGGGSTFGVATSFVVQTYPSPGVVSMVFVLEVSEQTDIWSLFAYFASQSPYLVENGISGYIYWGPNVTVTFSGADITLSGIIATVTLLDSQDTSQIYDIWEPIFSHTNQTWNGTTLIIESLVAYPTFADWFSVVHSTFPVGVDTYAGSRLMTNASVTNDLEKLGEALEAFAGSSPGAQTILVAGPGVWNAKPRGGNNAVNPAWRTAIQHLARGVFWDPLNVSVREAAIVEINEMTAPLVDLTPGGGAYLNENNPGAPNWQEAFWGSNYDRLLKIKRAVDPDDNLWCHPCVGNERWTEVGNQLCRK